MRILEVIEFFTPAKGGPVQVAYQISKNLAERGHDVTLWTSNYGLEKNAYAGAPFRVVLNKNIFSKWNFYVTPSMIRAAQRELSSYDVIHLHSLRTFQNVVIARQARRTNVPYVLSPHGSLPRLVQRKTAKKVFDLLAGYRLLDGAAQLIAVSPAEKQQFLEFGIAPDRISFVLNGLDLTEFAQLPDRGQFRQRWAIPEHAEVVLCLGRIHRIKGIDHLIAAFARLHTSVENAVLVIAGPDDGDLARLKRIVQDLGLTHSVRFPGGLFGIDKLAAMVDANVVAAPSQYEVFGLVPFEALMCGTPVVVTADSGSGQLLEQAAAGYAVRYGDIDALVDSLRRALLDKAASGELVRSGQAFVSAHLQWTAIAEKLERVYTASLSRNATAMLTEATPS